MTTKLNLFKNIFILFISITFCQENKAQLLIAEGPSNSLEANSFQCYPYKGGLFFIHNTPSKGYLVGQSIIYIDANNEKKYEVNTGSYPELAEKIVPIFNLNPNTGELWGVQFYSAISAPTSGTQKVNIIKITLEGKLTILSDVVIPQFHRGTFFRNENLVLYGNDNKHEDKKIANKNWASGKTIFTVIERDLSKYSEEISGIPYFQGEDNNSFYKILHYDNDFLYLVSESRNTKDSKNILFYFDFFKYDMNTKSISKNNKVTIEFKDKEPRMSSSNIFQRNAENGLPSRKSRSKNVIHSFYDKNTGTVILYGAYGINSKTKQGENFAGLFFARINEDKGMENIKFSPYSQEVMSLKQTDKYESSHHIELLTINGQNIVTLEVLIGETVFGRFHSSINYLNFDHLLKETPAKESDGQMILSNYFPNATKNIPAMIEKKSTWAFISSDKNEFVIVRPQKEEKFFMYKTK